MTYPIDSFVLYSRWTNASSGAMLSRPTTATATKTVTVSGIPDGSTVVSATLTVRTGSARSGAALSTICGQNAPENSSLTIDITSIVTGNGTFSLPFVFRANGLNGDSEGEHAGGLRYSEMVVTVEAAESTGGTQAERSGASSGLVFQPATVQCGTGTVSVSIEALSANHSHRLIWRLGTHVRTVALAAGMTETAFVFPAAWADAVPSGSATATLTLHTISPEGEIIGVAQTTLTVTAASSSSVQSAIPAEAAPWCRPLICVYDADATSWAGNGLAVLHPTACVVTEVAGGDYSLELEHPMTADGIWRHLRMENLIRVPVPVPPTAAYKVTATGDPSAASTNTTREIWRTTTTSTICCQPILPGSYAAWNPAATYTSGACVMYLGKAYRYVRGEAGNTSPYISAAWTRMPIPSYALEAVPAGTEVELVKSMNASWGFFRLPSGTEGYMLLSTVSRVRTESVIDGGTATIPCRLSRMQVFRIYAVDLVSNEQLVKVKAWHLSYDFAWTLIGPLSLDSVPLPEAVRQMRDAQLTPDNRQIMVTNDAQYSGDLSLKNGISCLLDPDVGLVPVTRSQLLRDNADLMLLPNIPAHRGYEIRYGKNMLGVTWSRSLDECVTRLIPVGTDEDGNPLLLPETYIDSRHIGEHQVIHAQFLEVSDAQVGGENEDGQTISTDMAYAMLREAAQAEFAKGVDLMQVNLDVDFIRLGDTAEYAAYRALDRVFLYDMVRITHAPMGLQADLQVRQIVWDVLRQRYNSIQVGNVFEQHVVDVAGYELPTGAVSGRKIQRGSISLANLSPEVRNLVVQH